MSSGMKMPGTPGGRAGSNPIHDSKLGPPGGALVPAQQKARAQREAKTIRTMRQAHSLTRQMLKATLLNDGHPTDDVDLIVKLIYPGRRRVAGTARNPVYSAGITERAGRQADGPLVRRMNDPKTGTHVPVTRIK